MKKILAVLIILMLTLSVSCNKKQETEVKSENKKEIAVKDAKKEEDKKEKTEDVNKNNAQEEKEKDTSPTSEITAIYFSENASVIFDKSINANDLENYVSDNFKEKLKDGAGLKIDVKDSKIVGLNISDSLEVSGTYIGLIDSNFAEFSYNSSIFRLYLSENQAEELEKIQENSLLHLKIIKNGDSFKLMEFSLK